MEFDVEEGSTYILSYNSDYDIIPVGIYDPAGEKVAMSYVSNVLNVTKTGTHVVKLSLNSTGEVQLPAEVTLHLSELLIDEGSIDGTWVLIEKRESSHGYTISRSYQPDSANQIIVIGNDSIATQTYWSIGDPLVSSFSDSRHGRNYQLEEDTLTLFSDGYYGKSRYVYRRFNQSVEDITWIQETFKASDGIMGSWYMTYFEHRWVDNYESEYEDIVETPTLVESECIYKLLPGFDTLYVYKRKNIGFSLNKLCDEEFVQDVEWLYRNGDDLISLNSRSYISGFDYFSSYSMKKFKKYLDRDIPADWTEVDVPQTTHLEVGVEYDEIVRSGDTLWYDIDLEKGQYVVSTFDNSINFNVLLVSSDGQYLSDQRFNIDVPFSGKWVIVVAHNERYSFGPQKLKVKVKNYQ